MKKGKLLMIRTQML